MDNWNSNFWRLQCHEQVIRHKINYLRENSLKIDKQGGLFIRKFWVYKRKSRNLTHVTNNTSTRHQSMKVLPSTNSFMLREQLTELLRGSGSYKDLSGTKKISVYVRFISYWKCSNWHRISKLSSNFGCLFTFRYLDGANSIKSDCKFVI